MMFKLRDLVEKFSLFFGGRIVHFHKSLHIRRPEVEIGLMFSRHLYGREFKLPENGDGQFIRGDQVWGIVIDWTPPLRGGVVAEAPFREVLALLASLALPNQVGLKWVEPKPGPPN